MSTRPFQLRTLTIGDDPATWVAAGFMVDGGTIRVGNTMISLVGTDRGRGILTANVDGLAGRIDGMPFDGTQPDPAEPVPVHANGVIALDHLVAMSPDMDRTTEALSLSGLEPRRTRTFDAGGSTRRQCFFWMGDVILELAGDDDAHGDGPALLWGLAFTCADLDESARRLGERLGPAKPAVQKAREIATLRTKELDISVPIVLMSPHPDDDAPEPADA
ncbi:MAG: hypothetical protein R2707_09760 [Acidimicrobiales bacterium]